jgi:hypothetical protein
MTKEINKVKIASDLPAPTALTRDVLERIEEEARKWRDAFEAQTLEMEQISTDDLKVRAQ